LNDNSVKGGAKRLTFPGKKGRKTSQQPGCKNYR